MTTLQGYISRANLNPPLGHLGILITPYWPLLGDTQDAADMSSAAGIAPGQSALKTVWASSPYVAGQQLVLATPDNSTLDMRLVVRGDSMVDAQDQLRPIIQAIRTQLTYNVSVTFQSATYTWACYTGTYLIAFNQLHFFGYLVPLYVTLPRTPYPISGPV